MYIDEGLYTIVVLGTTKRENHKKGTILPFLKKILYITVTILVTKYTFAKYQ